MSTSRRFFDEQFRRQIDSGEFDLNPFERDALRWLRGSVLDFGCGLGNLVLAAARAGHPVMAVDASATAIGHLASLAAREALPIHAYVADLGRHRIEPGHAPGFEGGFDCVVSIGLLMFFDCPTALDRLRMLQSLVNPGGVAIINVLVEGTTYLDMFDAEHHCLFAPDELTRRFDGWRILAHEHKTFPAPRGTLKAFATVAAERLR